MREPARRYSWPSFERGNTAAVKHGALSPRLVQPRATEMADALLGLANEPSSPIGYLADVSYGPAVCAWARVEAALERLDVFLAEQGEYDEDGHERPAVRRQDRLESRAESLRARLGLDPLARARLGRDVAAGQVDVARLFAEMDDDDEEDGDG